MTDDFASRELWLGITPEGGRVTDSFEENLFPDSAYKQPGPIRYRRTGKEASGTAGSKIASMMSPGTRTWEVLYYNQDVSGYVPLIGAQAIGTEGLVGEDPTPLWETTDVNGEFVTGCDHDEFYAYSFDIKAENSAVRIKPNTVVASEASAPAGCTDQQIITLSIPSHVFSRMRATVTTSIDFFGQSTALIPVGIDTTAANSYYFPTQDSISIKHIWGTTAREIQVHEYGHAYQDLTLGGIPTLEQPICSNHGTPVYTTLKCAYAEGFAEYFAAAILGSGVSVEYSDFEAGYDLLTNSNDSTADSNYPDPNGARVEGAVAAMFLDLTDPANETHDDVQFPGSYIASLIETCSVNYGGGSEPGTGVDHFIRCLEKQLDSGISSLFWPRTATPTSYSESATEPGSWNLTKIRTLWLKNLYDQ
ncbi:MAG: hypothetical protein ACRENP_11605 [Longimicrobiales bacterium]